MNLTEWLLFIFAVAVLIAFVAYFARTKPDTQAEDSSSMSPGSRRVLVWYLLVLGLILIYALIKISSAEFPAGNLTAGSATANAQLSPKAQIGLFVWHPYITQELQLLLLALLAGAIGSYVHAIQSLGDFIGNRTLTASWFWWYIIRPFLGMAMALIFYAVLRGGFLAGTPADAKVVNPFGVIAIGALVGMFADKAAKKLADIFDTLLQSPDERKDRLTDLVISTDKLPNATVGQGYSASIAVGGGTAPCKWSLADNPNWLNIDEDKGTLSGTPAAVGTSNITVKVTDKTGAAVTKAFQLTVNSANPPGNQGT